MRSSFRLRLQQRRQQPQRQIWKLQLWGGWLHRFGQRVGMRKVWERMGRMVVEGVTKRHQRGEVPKWRLMLVSSLGQSTCTGFADAMRGERVAC